MQLRRFIKDGTYTVDMATITGITPLHFACEIGSLPVAEFLVAEGADVNAYDNVRSLPPHPLAAHELTFQAPASPPQSGVRPLHTAVVYEKADLVRFLLSKGANPWLRTIDGETALDVAEADDLRTALQGRQRVHASAPVCPAGPRRSLTHGRLLFCPLSDAMDKTMDPYVSESGEDSSDEDDEEEPGSAGSAGTGPHAFRGVPPCPFHALTLGRRERPRSVLGSRLRISKRRPSGRPANGKDDT